MELAPWHWKTRIVLAEDSRPRSFAEFRRKWTPPDFCSLPLSERTIVLLGLLSSPLPISIIPGFGGFICEVVNISIHDATALLWDSSTNRQIAREANELFYKVGTILSGVSIDGTLTD